MKSRDHGVVIVRLTTLEKARLEKAAEDANLASAELARHYVLRGLTSVFGGVSE